MTDSGLTDFEISICHKAVRATRDGLKYGKDLKDSFIARGLIPPNVTYSEFMSMEWLLRFIDNTLNLAYSQEIHPDNDGLGFISEFTLVQDECKPSSFLQFIYMDGITKIRGDQVEDLTKNRKRLRAIILSTKRNLILGMNLLDTPKKTPKTRTSTDMVNENRSLLETNSNTDTRTRTRTQGIPDLTDDATFISEVTEATEALIDDATLFTDNTEATPALSYGGIFSANSQFQLVNEHYHISTHRNHETSPFSAKASAQEKIMEVVSQIVENINCDTVVTEESLEDVYDYSLIITNLRTGIVRLRKLSVTDEEAFYLRNDDKTIIM
jgi:hypothetical protein